MATMTIPWVIVSDVSRAESVMLPEPTGASGGLGHFFAPHWKAKVLAPKTLELQMETDQRAAGAEKAQK